MITTSMNPLTDEYKLMNSDSLFQGSTTPLYNDNNNNGIIVDNNNVVVPGKRVQFHLLHTIKTYIKNNRFISGKIYFRRTT